MMLDPHAAHRSLLAGGALPRLTWTGTGEYLELSGRVLATWGAKVANLLVELDAAGPEARVVVDLPVGWRACVWGLGCWLASARVVVFEAEAGDDDGAARVLGAGGADLVVTFRPQAWAEAAGVGVEVAAVALPSFALRWPGALPAGVGLDGNADVAAQPDNLGPVPGYSADAVALEVVGPGAVATHAFGDVPREGWFAVGPVLDWATGGDVTLAD